ncbi:hypothetical protein THAOC_08838, partial [Thalassiosira oceanica]
DRGEGERRLVEERRVVRVGDVVGPRAHGGPGGARRGPARLPRRLPRGGRLRDPGGGAGRTAGRGPAPRRSGTATSSAPCPCRTAGTASRTPSGRTSSARDSSCATSRWFRSSGAPGTPPRDPHRSAPRRGACM